MQFVVHKDALRIVPDNPQDHHQLYDAFVGCKAGHLSYNLSTYWDKCWVRISLAQFGKDDSPTTKIPFEKADFNETIPQR